MQPQYLRLLGAAGALSLILVGGFFLTRWYRQESILKEEYAYLQPLIGNSAVASSSYRYFYAPKAGSPVENPLENSPARRNIMNDDGLNNAQNFSVIKPADTFRIALLGDSVAFGYGLATKDNYASQLQDLLNRSECGEKFEVLNLAFPGYDFMFSAERLRLSGMKYDPDLILWHLSSVSQFTDIRNNSFPYDLWQRKHCDTEACKDVMRRSLAFHYDRLEAQNTFKLETDAIRDVASFAKKPIVMFTTTSMPRIFFGYFSTIGEREPLLSFYNIPDDALKPSDFLLNFHPNKHGSAVMAKLLKEHLQQKDLISCMR